MTYRNKKLLEVVRKLPCQICRIEDGTIVAAHSNQQRDGKGTGIKSADYRIAALCNLCHMGLDQSRAMSKTERMELWEDAHRRTIGELFEYGLLKV
jgi:hypothetical protein